MSLVYKICQEEEWRQACGVNHYAGSENDLRDGFIHLSTAQQLAGTAAKHFAGRTGLVLVAFAADDLGAALRWEVSRGGDRFPHVYGPLDPALALWVEDLPLCDGLPQLPAALKA